jgi:peptide/nickel transport system permease protein
MSVQSAEVAAGKISVRARRARTRRRGFGVIPKIGLGLLICFLIAAVFASLIAPENPLALHLNDTLTGPSSGHLLGTDLNGRDVLSRLIYGTRSSFEGVGIALGVTIVLAIPWGLAAGFGGQIADEILMRIGDGLLSFPPLVLAIGIVGVWGPDLLHSMIAVGIIFAPSVARLLRGSVLPLRRAEFVLVARALGVKPWRVALTHVLPNAMGPVLVQLFSLGSIALLLEAALGFLGLGVQAPTPAWGTDLAGAYQYFSTVPTATLFYGLTITIAAWSISVVGDGVRDVLA